HRDVALRRAQAGDDLVADRDRAGGLRLQAGDDPQRGRLAAAGRAEHHEQLAVADLEVELLHGDGPVRERLVELLDEHPGHQRRTAPSVTPATRCLRTRNANTSTGMAKIIAEAATSPQSIVVPPIRPAIAAGAVRESGSVIRKIE